MNVDGDEMYTKMTILILCTNSLFFATVPSAGAIGFIQVKSAAPQIPQLSVAVSHAAVQVARDMNIIVVGWKDSVAVDTLVYLWSNI